MGYRRKDAFYQQAKDAGLRSRAAFKLEQLQRQFHILRRGDRVVDLGAWPGGWLQVAARYVGPTGKVVGVDRVPVPPLPDFPQVQVLEADIESPEVQTRVAQSLGGAADVVLCDVSPKLTGVRERDWARARELAERAIELAAVWLRPGGTLLLKVFMSPNWKEIVDRLRSRFENVSSTRPEATRKGSSELYVIARGLRPDTASDS
jgi:23S rRNA (uridine2552-2'-O)-methyltransferase